MRSIIDFENGLLPRFSKFYLASLFCAVGQPPVPVEIKSQCAGDNRNAWIHASQENFVRKPEERVGGDY